MGKGPERRARLTSAFDLERLPSLAHTARARACGANEARLTAMALSMTSVFPDPLGPSSSALWLLPPTPAPAPRAPDAADSTSAVTAASAGASLSPTRGSPASIRSGEGMGVGVGVVAAGAGAGADGADGAEDQVGTEAMAVRWFLLLVLS